MTKKSDFFTKYGIKPDYKDVDTLKKFLTPRGKILSKDKSGLTAKHQRDLGKMIKYARYMALLSYTSYQKESLKHYKKIS